MKLTEVDAHPQTTTAVNTVFHEILKFPEEFAHVMR
jgi:hypothetical protein